MKGVDTIARIRREFFSRGLSISAAARRLGISRQTVRRVLAAAAVLTSPGTPPAMIAHSRSRA